MADRGHADSNQVVGRQLAQHLGVDIVVAERRLILSSSSSCSQFPMSMAESLQVSSERIQKRNQIGLLLVRQPDCEALIVELYDALQGGG